MTRAFVTGGSGFVGRNVIRALRERGWKVVAAARSDAAARAVAAAGAEPVPAELSGTAALAAGMAGCDLVVHAAAKVEPWGPREEFHRVNVEGTENVLAAARSAGVPRLVHVGTEAVLADGRPIVNADESRPIPPRPLGAYALTKALAEERVRAASGPGLATVVVRPRFIWGRDDTSLLPKLVDAARRGTLAWISGGRYLTSTCHVANVAHGVVLAAERGRSGGVYFLTDGPPIEFRAFVTALLRTQGIEAPARAVPRWMARALGAALEAVWPERAAHPPPITRTLLAVMGVEVTVNDARARAELGYGELVTRAQGMEELAAAAQGAGRAAASARAEGGHA
ncbi:MAG TPA: NAD-dependent epimerase/dehydratase family protein [Anaeromyxobacter sp.]|nr:NAD-dependent epimerase/dehydratase family protein [Anaeromyxobacter sp.]